MNATNQPITIYCERLSVDEETDFLVMVNDAVTEGELTNEEAAELIDREFELLSQMAA